MRVALHHSLSPNITPSPRATQVKWLRHAIACIAILLIAIGPVAVLAQDDPASTGDMKPKEHSADAAGSFSQSFPITLPPFRGLEPSLAISYNSSTRNSDLGHGWSLSGLSVIERASLRDGAPRYDDAKDVFLLDGEEVFVCPGLTGASCATGGTHTTEIESFLRIKRDLPNNRWEITGTSGTKLTYKTPSTWTTYDTGNANEVKEATDYRWLLSDVTDTHGNTVTYAYTCDGVPDCFIDTISYNGNTVKIYWETRPDPISYATGAGIGQINKRVKTIDVKVGVSRLQALAVTYRVPVAGVGAAFRSRVTSIQEFGRNATVNTSTGEVSGGLSLPATTFIYSGNADVANGATLIQNNGSLPPNLPTVSGDFNGDGFTEQATGLTVRMWDGGGLVPMPWTQGAGTLPEDAVVSRWSVADFNGDGMDDIAGNWSYEDDLPGGGSTTINESRIFLSTGSGFTNGGPVPVPATSNARIADVDGDGAWDFVTNGHTCTPVVDRWTGASFTQENWPISNCGTIPSGVFEEADLNGDGKGDFMIRKAAPSGLAINVTVRVSNGSSAGGFTGDVWSFERISGEPLAGASWWYRGDFNGDGKVDIGHVWNSGVNLVSARVYLSTGKGFVGQDWATLVPGRLATATPKLTVALDANGDGRDDIFLPNTSPWKILLSTGSGFVSQTYLNVAAATGSHKESKADFNGDGLEEPMATSSGTAIAYVTNGPFPDLLTSVTNSLGGTTTVEYLASSWVILGTGKLPFVMQVVDETTINDGRGNQSTISYEYYQANWDAPTRRFLGYTLIGMHHPLNAGESQFPTTCVHYLPDARTHTRIERINESQSNMGCGASSVRFTRTEYEYSPITASIPYVSNRVATTLRVYEEPSFKQTKITNTFDVYGNVVEAINHGDLALTGDEITARLDFYANTTAYIVGLPGRVRTHAGVGTGGTLLTDKYAYYDGAAAYTTPSVKGDITQRKVWLNLPTSGFITSTATYDTYGNLTSSTDPIGSITTTIYDTTYHLFPIEVRDPLYATDTRHKVLTSWDYVCGLPDEITDLNGQITDNDYDNLCRPTRTESPNGNFTLTSYNNIGTPANQNIRIVTPKPGATMMPTDGDTANLFGETYMDGLGRTYRTAAKGPTNIETLTTFTKRGTVASQTAPFYSGGTQYATTWKYDALDRKIERQHPDSNKVTGAYGLSSVTTGFQRVTVTDELLRPATIHTDAYGRTVRSDRKLGSATVSTHYQYDLLGRLTGLTDNGGNQWTYTYDTLGRRLTANDPDLGSWAYLYDDASRLTDQTDAKGQVTHFTYDALGRVLTKVAKYGTGSQETTTYTYDEARATYHNVGHLTTAANAAGTIKYDFDKDGRQVRQQYVVDSTTHTITDGYDIGGRLLSRTYPDSDSVGTITYDAGGRLKTVPSLVTDTLYDARSQVTSITRANAVNSTYTYSPQRGFLTGVSTVKSSTVLQDYTYGRDARGRITGVTSSQAGEGWTYGYDDKDRLLSADNTTDNSLDQIWTYDTVDNMLTNSLVGTYSYPASGTIRPHGVTGLSGGPLGTQSFTYDSNGAMTNQNGDTRTYDGENRLITAVDGATTTQFVYGPDGARLKKIVGATVTLYLGADIEKTGTTWTKYLPGDAKRVGTGGAYYWMHRDHLQSVRVETDSTGVIRNNSKYRPFGDRVAGVTTIAEAKGFIGERHDSETGLMYLNARYYDPVLGRFMSGDPMSPTLPGVGVNRYAYAFNSPIIMLDPSGLASGGGNWADQSRNTHTSEKTAHGSLTDPRGNPKDDDSFRRLTELYFEGRLDAAWNARFKAAFEEAGGNYVASWDETALIEDIEEMIDLLESITLPDYVAVNFNFPIPNPYTGVLVGFSGTVTFDKYGNLYDTYGLSFGRALTGVNLAAFGGWMSTNPEPTEDELETFVTGWSDSFTAAGWGVFMQHTHVFGVGHANEFGIGTVQIGASVQYGHLFDGNFGVGWSKYHDVGDLLGD
jgi:RHS repeat-associated protein